MPSSVFLSYVRENAFLVEQLKRALETSGINTWLAPGDLAPGAHWKIEIRRAIHEANAFIACFSVEYHQRTDNGMNEELTLAIERLRQRPVDSTWLIPVKLVPCALPELDIGGSQWLSDLHYVELYPDWEAGVKRLSAALLGQQPLSLSLTQREQVVRAHASLEPLQGHALVIYEQLAGREPQFHSVLPPGQRLTQRWWSLRNYFAIAVHVAPTLRLTFSKHFSLDDHGHEFDLRFDLSYHVTEPERVATTRNADPLGQLRDEIIRVIGYEIVQSSWVAIKRNFQDVEQAVHYHTAEKIRTYAVTLGFGVLSIALHPRFREQDLPDPVAEAEARMRQVIIDMLSTAIHNSTLPELGDLYEKLRVMLKAWAGSSGGASEPSEL